MFAYLFRRSAIEDTTVLTDDRSVDFPAVIIDAAFARKLIETNELPLVVDRALKAMELSGQRFGIVTEAEEVA